MIQKWCKINVVLSSICEWKFVVWSKLSIILEGVSSKQLSKYGCDFRAIAVAVIMELKIASGKLSVVLIPFYH